MKFIVTKSTGVLTAPATATGDHRTAPPAPVTQAPVVFASTLASDHLTAANLHGNACLFEGTAVPTPEQMAALFAPPPAPAPTVTPLQMRLALNQIGLRATVDAAVAGADQITRDSWEYATEIRRDNALLAQLATALGKSTDDLDGIFRLAGSL